MHTPASKAASLREWVAIAWWHVPREYGSDNEHLKKEVQAVSKPEGPKAHPKREKGPWCEPIEHEKEGGARYRTTERAAVPKC